MQPCKYTIIRSNRKTIAIYIKKDATVEVRAPIRVSKALIDRFIYSKQAWIMEHLMARQRKNEEKAEFALNYGDSIFYRGKLYPISARSGNRVGFDEGCFYMPHGLSSREIKAAAIQIYKMLAKSLLTEKAMHFAHIMGLYPSAVKINSAKTRWGSCSGKNSINFSWRLVLGEDSLIDYVVVHELAHIKELNHSDRFWDIVRAVLPDYRAQQLKLKALNERLSKEDWD